MEMEQKIQIDRKWRFVNKNIQFMYFK